MAQATASMPNTYCAQLMVYAESSPRLETICLIKYTVWWVIWY